MPNSIYAFLACCTPCLVCMCGAFILHINMYSDYSCYYSKVTVLYFKKHTRVFIPTGTKHVFNIGILYIIFFITRACGMYILTGITAKRKVHPKNVLFILTIQFQVSGNQNEVLKPPVLISGKLNREPRKGKDQSI